MCPLNNITNHKKYKHLTEIERYKIEAYLKDNKKAWQIAELLGKSERTIQREIKRGTVTLLDSELREYKIYCADVAQRKYYENAANKGRGYKIGNDYELVEYIERMIIEEKYSPDTVIGRLKLEGNRFKTTICTKTLYNYIDTGLFLHLTNKDLPVKKDGKKRAYRRTRVALKNTKGTSIEERPKEIENREEIIFKRKGKTRTKVFYAHPFSSWERGTNENTNKLIRRFIPKGSSIDDIPLSMIKYIENWLNNYPRRILGYRTPNEVKVA